MLAGWLRCSVLVRWCSRRSLRWPGWCPVWAAALIVGVVVLLVAGLLALTGIGQIKRGAPPLPEQAIASVGRDIQTVKDSAKR